MRYFDVLLGCLLAAGTLAAEPMAFEVQGYMETRHLLASNPTNAINRRVFTFATDGRDLFIHCGAGTWDRGVAYCEFGTDGTNGFALDQTTLRANSTNRSGMRLVNDSTMVIELDVFPPSGAARQVWLVYGSRDELRRRTNSFVRPTTPILLRERSFDGDLFIIMRNHLELRAEWSFDEKPPQLLKHYADFRDGRFNTDRYAISLIPDEYMTGKTNSQMEVLSWTNVAGLHIPSLAQLITYVADTNRSGMLQEDLVHRIIATNVVAGTTRRSFVPKLGRATSVYDHRFMNGPRQPASYLSTNGVIFSTAEEAWDEVERQREEGRRR